MVNFKKFQTFEVEFDDHLNILIGDNESGKSTILQAIDFVLSGSRNKVENTGLENLFNNHAISNFMESPKRYEDLPVLVIELYLDEKKQDIEINNCTFSFLVTGNESRTNSSGYRHELTLRGCWEDGNEFEFEFSLVNDMDELVAIVYAMIIVAESKNLEKASEMWQIIRPEYFTRNAAQRLQRVIAGEEFFKNIREKYPFMTQVFKDGLNYQIEEAKKEINNLDFLK